MAKFMGMFGARESSAKIKESLRILANIMQKLANNSRILCENWHESCCSANFCMEYCAKIGEHFANSLQKLANLRENLQRLANRSQKLAEVGKSSQKLAGVGKSS
jgi:argininosuccinate lyase